MAVPALDQMLAAAHPANLMLCWSGLQIGLLAVCDISGGAGYPDHMGVEFASFRENMDTGGRWAEGW